MIVEEFATIVGMDLMNRKGQAIQDLSEALLHYFLASAQDSSPLAPACSHINHLQGMDIVSLGNLTTMMDQIGLKVSWCLLVPRDSLHRDLFTQLISLAWSFTRKLGSIAS